MTRSPVKPHRFEPDPSVPADFFGRSYCRWCQVPGVPGDDRHPIDAPTADPLPPTPAEVAELEARRLGERLDDGER